MTTPKVSLNAQYWPDADDRREWMIAFFLSLAFILVFAWFVIQGYAVPGTVGVVLGIAMIYRSIRTLLRINHLTLKTDEQGISIHLWNGRTLTFAWSEIAEVDRGHVVNADRPVALILTPEGARQHRMWRRWPNPYHYLLPFHYGISAAQLAHSLETARYSPR